MIGLIMKEITNILILFIIIINVWLRSHQQMAQQDLPLVSYGFLTGFRGISDLPDPCTFNTGFQPSQSQVGLPWQTVQKGKSNIRYQEVSSENMLLVLEILSIKRCGQMEGGIC